MSAETITVNVKVCRDCGGRYSTPGLASMHNCQQGPGHNFKTVKETRPKPESRISYQPGYGPSEPRLVASESANAVNSEQQIERLAQQGDVTQ